MLPNIALEQLLLLDIETTPAAPAIEQLSDDMQQLWREKIAKTAPVSGNDDSAYADRAGIYAEFGKIVCISAGFFSLENNRYQLRLKSFYNDDEAVVL